MTFARCCNFPICFNCKSAGRHETCDDALKPIDEKRCMASCRSCRRMIVKVGGCDAVMCQCGYSMSWGFEAEQYALWQRQLLPVDDFFNESLVNDWSKWHRALKIALRQCVDVAREQ